MTNLPSQLTPFIGREAEIEQLCALLAETSHRLITLTGLGGIGKTRLALAVGQTILDVRAPRAPAGCLLGANDFGFEILDSTNYRIPPLDNQKSKISNPKFPDGVWFVPLVGLVASENLVDTLAVAIGDALQLLRSAAIAPAEQLLDYLRDRTLLLILDNFEHLLAGADFVGTLLQNAPGIKLLVTSRQRLNLPTEFVRQLNGLAVPEVEVGMAMTPGKVQSYDSVALFVERAQRANRTFRPDQTNQSEILHICRIVEGLPLGIELAAAMTRHTNCRQLWQTLQQDYRTLTTTQRDLAPRHRSLTAMLDYSWRLLTPTQAHVLMTCTLFPQAFTLETSAAIANMPDEGTGKILSALVDQSLLKQTTTGRFEMHELVRHYAIAQVQLAPQEAAQRQQRYALYYIHLIEQDANELLRSPDKFQRVRQELANLRLVWQWCVDHHQIESMLQIGNSLFLHYLLQGPLQEGWQWANLGLQMLRRIPPDTLKQTEYLLWSSLVAAQAYFAYFLGRYDEAAQLTEEALLQGPAQPDRRVQAMVYHIRGMLALARGEVEEQEKHFQRTQHYAQAGRLPYLLVTNLAYHGVGLAIQGKVSEAVANLQDALQILHDHGLVMLEDYVLSELSFVYTMTGDWARAGQTSQQALEVGQSLNNNLHRGWQYELMALYAEGVGDYASAMVWTKYALDHSATFHDRANQMKALLIRGRVLRHAADWPAAEEALQKALTTAQELHYPLEIAKVQVELGHVQIARRLWSQAPTHYQIALALATMNGLPTLAAAQAGLASFYFQQNVLDIAMSWVESALPILLTHPLESQYDAATAMLTCYQILDAINDLRAATLLHRAYGWVEAQSLKISDETLRRSFLENVPPHRQLLTAAQPTGIGQHDPA